MIYTPVTVVSDRGMILRSPNSAIRNMQSAGHSILFAFYLRNLRRVPLDSLNPPQHRLAVSSLVPSLVQTGTGGVSANFSARIWDKLIKCSSDTLNMEQSRML
jgi:hypothetical protein